MGLFTPNAKPRRFHLEIPESELRKQRLRKLEEEARCDMTSCSAGESARMTDHDFSRLRGSFRHERCRGMLSRGPMLASALWIFLLVVVLSALWIWLLN